MSITTPTVPSPPRRNIIYPIPSSTLTLDVILNVSRPLSPASVLTCIAGAVAQAHTHPPSSLVEGVCRHCSPETEPVAELGIVGTVIVNQLTWGDVIVVLRGLEEFLKRGEGEEGRWMACLWYLMDKRRGALGDGYLEPTGLKDGQGSEP